MASNEPCLKIGMLLALIAIPTTIVAISVPWWAFKEDEFFGENWNTNIGLWKWCRETIRIDGESTTVCRTHTSPERTARHVYVNIYGG